MTIWLSSNKKRIKNASHGALRVLCSPNELLDAEMNNKIKFNIIGLTLGVARIYIRIERSIMCNTKIIYAGNNIFCRFYDDFFRLLWKESV